VRHRVDGALAFADERPVCAHAAHGSGNLLLAAVVLGDRGADRSGGHDSQYPQESAHAVCNGIALCRGSRAAVWGILLEVPAVCGEADVLNPCITKSERVYT